MHDPYETESLAHLLSYPYFLCTSPSLTPQTKSYRHQWKCRKDLLSHDHLPDIRTVFS